jgi:DNA-binding SARP family transcriptional activator
VVELELARTVTDWHSTADISPASVSLFGGFTLTVGGRRTALPMHAKRVLAYLSVQKMARSGCDRSLLAERLWPDTTPARCRASLRTALWRIRCLGPELLIGDTGWIALADDVTVDVHDFRRCAEELLASDSPHQLNAHVYALPSPVDLLPGWDEDWLLLIREQLRLLRLHALEHGAEVLSSHGLHPQAIDLILRVVSEEPLRESAQAVLIKAHLHVGNAAEARRQLDGFAAQLRDQLGIRPSEELEGLLRSRR